MEGKNAGTPLTLTGEPAAPPPPDPHKPVLPEGAPEAVEEAARGRVPDMNAERDVLDWLLAPQAPIVYEVPVEFDTEKGSMKLLFIIQSLDSMVIDRIERDNMDMTTGRSADLTINAEVVAAALIKFRSPTSGREIEISDAAFMSGVPSPAVALEQRFHWQAGLLAGVASEVRRASGWAPDRVGTARRTLVDVGKSASGSAA